MTRSNSNRTTEYSTPCLLESCRYHKYDFGLQPTSAPARIFLSLEFCKALQLGGRTLASPMMKGNILSTPTYMRRSEPFSIQVSSDCMSCIIELSDMFPLTTRYHKWNQTGIFLENRAVLSCAR